MKPNMTYELESGVRYGHQPGGGDLPGRDEQRERRACLDVHDLAAPQRTVEVDVYRAVDALVTPRLVIAVVVHERSHPNRLLVLIDDHFTNP